MAPYDEDAFLKLLHSCWAIDCSFAHSTLFFQLKGWDSGGGKTFGLEGVIVAKLTVSCNKLSLHSHPIISDKGSQSSKSSSYIFPPTFPNFLFPMNSRPTYTCTTKVQRNALYPQSSILTHAQITITKIIRRPYRELLGKTQAADSYMDKESETHVLPSRGKAIKEVFQNFLPISSTYSTHSSGLANDQ